MHNIFSTSNMVEYPDIFLTLKGNPWWPGIMIPLLAKYNVMDRSDIIARIIHIQLRAIMNFVVGEQNFMKLNAHVIFIELQKVALLHTHCISLMTQKSNTSMLVITFIDTIILAELTNERYVYF